MATIISNKTREIQERFVKAGFTPEEIQAVRDAWNHGLWGETEGVFADEDQFGVGVCTNDIELAGNFKGREVTNICRKIANRIRTEELDWISHFNDWWGDGSGDMLFIAEKVGSWDELTEWAKTPADAYEVQAEQGPVQEQAPKQEKSSEKVIKIIFDAVARIKKYATELAEGKADKKREASLNRKIARAEATLLREGAVFRLFNKELGCWGEGAEIYTSLASAIEASSDKCRDHSIWVVVGVHNNIQISEIDPSWWAPLKK